MIPSILPLSASLSSLATRILLIVALALAAHFGVVLMRRLSGRILRSRSASQEKVQTVVAFGASVAAFAIYFAAVGFILREFGISLAAYLASASIIGLAVSFGSQGLVQDVITGLTVVFSDLVDVGDMVEIGGQVGIVDGVGIRFTTLINFTGARVYVPNRTIANVINYRGGYVRAYLDARLPADPGAAQNAKEILQKLAESAYEQYPGIMFFPPTIEGTVKTTAGFSFKRLKFRIWPGQGALLENGIKPCVVQALRSIDPTYSDWMVSVHYRAEPSDGDPARRLPRPAPLRGPSGTGAAGTSRRG